MGFGGSGTLWQPSNDAKISPASTRRRILIADMIDSRAGVSNSGKLEGLPKELPEGRGGGQRRGMRSEDGGARTGQEGKTEERGCRSEDGGTKAAAWLWCVNAAWWCISRGAGRRTEAERGDSAATASEGSRVGGKETAERIAERLAQDKVKDSAEGTDKGAAEDTTLDLA